jgi:hypothetical protein
MAKSKTRRLMDIAYRLSAELALVELIPDRYSGLLEILHYRYI